MSTLAYGNLRRSPLLPIGHSEEKRASPLLGSGRFFVAIVVLLDEQFVVLEQPPEMRIAAQLQCEPKH
jgi:hypothetical protein